MVTLLFLVLVSDIFLDNSSANLIGRIDGIILMAVAVAYTLYSVKHNNFVPDESETVENIASPAKAALWIISGIVVLFIG